MLKTPYRIQEDPTPTPQHTHAGSTRKAPIRGVDACGLRKPGTQVLCPPYPNRGIGLLWHDAATAARS